MRNNNSQKLLIVVPADFAGGVYLKLGKGIPH